MTTPKHMIGRLLRRFSEYRYHFYSRTEQYRNAKRAARSLRGRKAVVRRKMVHADELPGLSTGAELPTTALAEGLAS